MKKAMILTVVMGLMLSMVSMIGAVEVVENPVSVIENLEQGLYKLENNGDGAQVELVKENGVEVPFYMGTGGRYIEVKENGVSIKLHNTKLLKVEKVEVKENNSLKEGVYVVGKDLKAGTYTFRTTSEYGGIVQKLTSLEVAEGVELGDVFFIETGEIVDVEVFEGDILQVIQAESK